MSTTWILVANARHARLFANHGPNKGLELVQEAMADEEILESKKTIGRASPHGEPPKHAAHGFAHRLARDLAMGRSSGSYSRAILVAPPAFMGMLNSELDPPTASLVSGRLDKDYTRAEPTQLCSHLEGCLCV